MASVYKRTRDIGNKSAVYYVAYTDHDGRRRTVKGFRDKGVTEQLAARLEHEVMLKKRGLIDPAAEQQVRQKQRPVEEHLAEFAAQLLTRDRSKNYRELVVARLRRVFDGCGFQRLGDLDKSRAEA